MTTDVVPYEKRKMRLLTEPFAIGYPCVGQCLRDAFAPLGRRRRLEQVIASDRLDRSG